MSLVFERQTLLPDFMVFALCIVNVTRRQKPTKCIHVFVKLIF